MNLPSLIKSFDDLPQVIKLILAVPALDIVWVIYRILRSVNENNALGIIVGGILLFVGVPFLWLVDIICILTKNTVWWF